MTNLLQARGSALNSGVTQRGESPPVYPQRFTRAPPRLLARLRRVGRPAAGASDGVPSLNSASINSIRSTVTKPWVGKEQGTRNQRHIARLTRERKRPMSLISLELERRNTHIAHRPRPCAKLLLVSDCLVIVCGWWRRRESSLAVLS